MTAYTIQPARDQGYVVTINGEDNRMNKETVAAGSLGKCLAYIERKLATEVKPAP